VFTVQNSIRSSTSYGIDQESLACAKRHVLAAQAQCIQRVYPRRYDDTCKNIPLFILPRYPACIGTYGTGRSLFTFVRFSYERFIESENAIVAVKRARMFHSRAKTRFTWIPHRDFKPDHNGTRVTRFAGHRSHFVCLHLGNSLVPDERANLLRSEMQRKCSRSHRSGYVAGNVGSLHCLRYTSAFVRPQPGNSHNQFQSKRSIVFSLHLFFCKKL